MRAFVSLVLLLVGCTPSAVTTIRPASIPPNASTSSSETALASQDATCPPNAEALFATIPFGSLSLAGVTTPLWTGTIEGAAHLAGCLAFDVDERRVQLLASFVVDDDALTNQVLVAMFEGGAFARAVVVRGPAAEPVVPANGCAEALGLGSAPAIRAFALESGAGIGRALVRIGIVRDVCGVACGRLSTDVTLLSVTPDTLALAFACRLRDEPYIVSNEQAENYSCDRTERELSLRVVDGALERCTMDASPTCQRYGWDGARFTSATAPESACLD